MNHNNTDNSTKTPTPNAPQTDLNQIDEEPNQKPKKHHNKKHKHNNSSSSSEHSELNHKKPKENPQIIKDLIAENFVLLTLIGKGAFGQIILSFNMREDIEVAIKKEMRKPNKPPQLKTEAKVYTTLLNISMPDLTGVQLLKQETVQGVPTFYGMGEFQDFYYLIMEFLGPNLIELLNYCNTKKFTISTVCLIALQLLNRIENIHKHHFLHRDIKPENFLIGTQEKSNIIYLIDFGLSKRYKNPKNHQHIPYREGRLLTGTARYVSINTHLGIEQSRRDDLESIGYVLIFFLKGSLPWQGLKGANDKYVRIMEKKLQIPTEILCYGLPDEISYYLNYCKSLRFEDRPDYDYLRQLFIKLLGSCNTMYGLTKEYLKFDWCFDDPSNTIWQVFAKGKKGKLNEEMILGNNNNKESGNISLNNTTKQRRVSNDVTNNGKGASLKVTGNDKLGPKQLSNIDEGEGIGEEKENATKTNENNPIVSNNSSSGMDDSKSKENSHENNSYESEDTIKEEFKGVIKPELIDLINGEIVEDIDKYIAQLLQGSTFLKKISNKEKEKIEEQGVIIGKKKGKLKDSLDLGNNEHEQLPNNNDNKSAKSNEDDDDEDESPNQKELMKNTMRNSKILSPEDLAKIAANNAKLIKEKQEKQQSKVEPKAQAKKRVSKIQFKEESVKSKSSSKSSNKSSNKSSSKSQSSFDSSKSSKKQEESNNYSFKNNTTKKEETTPPTSSFNNGKSNNNNLLGKKTFEAEIMPKLANNERRKSKILEMNMIPK